MVSQVPLFVLSRLLSSLWVSRTGSASDWCALQQALYKCIDTIQHNTHTKYTHIHTHTHTHTHTHFPFVLVRVQIVEPSSESVSIVVDSTFDLRCTGSLN